MKARFRPLILLILTTILVVCIVPVQGTTGSDLLRIGLYYGSDALTSANLQNVTGYGSGYRFGYYADDLTFIELARTDESVTKVTVLRTSIYYRSGTTYSMTDNGGDAIGYYHIIIGSGYSSYEEAKQVADSYDGGFVAHMEGEYQVRVGAYLTNDLALAAQANLGGIGTITTTSYYSFNVVETGSSQIIFQYDGGSADSALGIYPDVTGAEEVQTWFKGYKYEGAFRYTRPDGGNITVTTVIDLETYVKGVIPYEMNNSWPLEALKAQAICARTYAQIGINSSKHSTFELCNSTCCQVYNGVGTSSSTYQANETTDQAVEETAGEFLWYNGQLASTYYSSSHGGGSENSQNVWGGDTTNLPYLWGVIDPYESLVADINSYSSWTRTYTSSEILTMLQSSGYGIGTTLDGIEAVYSSTGNVIQLIFHYANGKTNTFSPDTMRSSSKLALPSIRFTINGNAVEVTESASSLIVNDGDTLADLNKLYTINGSNSKKSLDTDDTVYVITGTGDIQAVDFTALSTGVDTSADLSGTTYTQATTYVFDGAGWGHSIGLSQYGAYAMADVVGMSYDEIVTFYFPGTYVSTTG